MTVEEFIARYYPSGLMPGGEPLPGRREEFNRRNSVYLCHGIRPDLLFIGDSIIDWWEIQAYFQKYGHCVNRGIGGEVTGELCLRFGQDCIDLHPRYAVVLEGINDIGKAWRESKEKGFPAGWQADCEKEILSNFAALLQMAKEASLPLGICSVLPIGCRDERNEVILSLNEQLKPLAASYGADYIDLYAEVVDESGLLLLKNVHFGDELHPHVAGYDRMAKAVERTLDHVFSR